MKVKCLVIHGSYRRGNTYRVTETVKNYMNELGECSFEDVYLKDLDMKFCLGCNQCFLHGEIHCPYQGVIQPLANKLEAADVLIITSPTYSLALSSLVKCWIDHMSYKFHRPSYFTKKALVITTTVGAGADSTGKYLSDTLTHWGFNWVDRLPVRCGGLDYQPDDKTLKRIKRAAENLYVRGTSKQLQGPSYKKVVFFNVWRAMALYGKKENSADFRYWQATELDKYPFSPACPPSFGKKAIGNTVYWLAKKVMKLS